MQLELECTNCNKKFSRNCSVNKEKIKSGHKPFCSRRCNGLYTAKSRKVHPNWNGGISEKDDLTPFRVFLAKVKKNGRAAGRNKKKKVSLTASDLKNQWDKQNGKCPYTGWQLEYKEDFGTRSPLSIYTATVDRIDSNKDYTVDNIEFVSLLAQYAKNRFSKNDVLLFCKAVVKNKKLSLRRAINEN